MSAYLVTDDTIDMILTAARAVQAGEARLNLWVGDATRKHNIMSDNCANVVAEVSAPTLVDFTSHNRDKGWINREQIRESDWTPLGVDLLWYNYLSLNHRYGDPMPTTIDYTFTPYPGISAEKLENEKDVAARVMGAISGYEYQTCEFPEFQLSYAGLFMSAVTKVIWETAIGRVGWTVDGRDDLQLGTPA
jgi:hypothetical protein